MPALALLIGSTWLSWIGLSLALVAAVAYLIIASPARPEDYKSPPRLVMSIAGAAYLVGGLLILLGDSRLLLVGATVNVLVLAAFIGASVSGRATIDRLSLVGKAAQVGLERVRDFAPPG